MALVGAGPGDEGLLTLRGARLLAQATVVLYDDLVGAGVLEHMAPEALRIYVGKRAGRAALSQEEIQAEILRLAGEGHRVVRLKGGDPLVFGRGLEELRACQEAGVIAELVPGISSALAAPAYVGTALTLRGVSSCFTVVTGHEDPTKPESDLDWGVLARTPGTLVVLMGMGRLRQITAQLLVGGRPGGTPAAVIQWGTGPAQREVRGTLATLPGVVEQAGISSPAVIVIGEVASADHSVPWLKQARPLSGWTIADTRQGRMGEEFRMLAGALGAEVLSFPLIRTVAELDPGDLTGSAGDWLVFSSAAGVRIWSAALEKRGEDSRGLAGRLIAAVGPSTAQALREERGVIADLVAKPSRQEGLLQALQDRIVPGQPQRVVLMGGDRTDPGLARGLEDKGWTVEQRQLYRVENRAEVREALIHCLKTRGVDAVVLSSGSAVDILADGFRDGDPGERELVKRIRWITIGPVTSARVEKRGWSIGAEAEQPTAAALCEAVLRARQESADRK